MDFISLWLAYQLNVVSPTPELARDFSNEELEVIFQIAATEQQPKSPIQINLDVSGDANPEEVALNSARSLQLALGNNNSSDSFWTGVLNTLKQSIIRVMEALQQLINVQSDPSEDSAIAQEELVTEPTYSQLRYLGIKDINNLTRISLGEEINDFAPMKKKPVVSPDVESLRLASVAKLEQEPQRDTFEPQVGTRFHDDGSVTLRVLVGNDFERLHVIGDFNNWGEVANIADYQLQPLPDHPHIHAITLPPGDYHKQQYRLVDQDGEQRVDLGATLLSTPAFNERFYEHQKSHELNSVFWKPDTETKEEGSPLDLRGKQLTIAETDVLSMALKWECQNPHWRRTYSSLI